MASRERLPTAIPPYRWFARIRTFDISCAGCGIVYLIRTLKRISKQAKSTRAYWDPAKLRFRCPSCGWTATLGIIAWIPSRRIAYDATPTIAQSEAIRLSLSRIAEEKADGTVNRLALGDPRSASLEAPAAPGEASAVATETFLSREQAQQLAPNAALNGPADALEWPPKKGE